MANIARWDPFEDSIDDLMRGIWLRPARFDKQEALQLKIDVKENPTAYTVHAEIPGVKKEDIHVTVEGNQVAISAEVKRESEVKQDERVLRSERYSGRVYRAFTLAQDVDQDSAKARYDNGVL
ncbi:MAG: Hsp20/alpha crystallin family protein, partial [Betaproteobacteria bacterium]|nr:Hsp20/alpha crystallin family protein [Betaproteobacteria bacterium]